MSLEKQEVIVKGTIPYDTLLEKIKKTGKEVCMPALSSVCFPLTASPVGSFRSDCGMNTLGGCIPSAVYNIVYK